MNDENKIIGPGVCDCCGEEADWLQVVNAAPVVGATICRACFDRTADNLPPEVKQHAARAVAWAIHDYEQTTLLRIYIAPCHDPFFCVPLARLRDLNLITGHPGDLALFYGEGTRLAVEPWRE